MNTIIKFQAKCKCGKTMESVPFELPRISAQQKMAYSSSHARVEFIRHNWVCIPQCCGKPDLWLCTECSANRKTIPIV